MAKKDKIKAKALEKLDKYVESQLKYHQDVGQLLEAFSMDMFDDFLSDEERIEIKNSIKQLTEGNVVFYCSCRDIEIPSTLIRENHSEKL